MMKHLRLFESYTEYKKNDIVVFIKMQDTPTRDMTELVGKVDYAGINNWYLFDSKGNEYFVDSIIRFANEYEIRKFNFEVTTNNYNL